MSGSRHLDTSSRPTVSFGLSKDVHAPVMVKICYMITTKPDNNQLVKLSQKYENARVFNTLSNVYRNSDLYIELSIYDGSNNLITTPIQTSYKSFNNNKREWNQYLTLAITYNQIPIDSYLKFELYEIVETKPKQFGVGYLSMFNKKNSTLRTGSQKIPVYRNVQTEIIQYEDIPGLTELEKLQIRHENGEFKVVSWLDKQVLPSLSKYNEVNTDHDYYLYLELVPFELPILYSDINYQIPTFHNNTSKVSTAAESQNLSVVLNSIDIPNAIKVYDPDYQFFKYSENINQNNTLDTEPDPIESKYHKLERKINNPILDKELKPTPQLRDELVRILLKPSHVELTEIEKNWIWKFRYYFSKNNTSNDPSNKLGSAKSFLPKFLKSIDWDTDNELDHAFEEIIPRYWSVEKLQMGDALDLLSNYFNPFTLGENALSSNGDVKSSGTNKKEETKFQKIFRYVTIIRNMAVDRLKLASSDELLLYLLQLVQTLKYEAFIFERDIPGLPIEENGNKSPLRSPLAKFLIERSVQSEKLGNFFYWYVKVENEDYLNQVQTQNQNQNQNQQQQSQITSEKIYAVVMDIYIKSLKGHCKENNLPGFDNLRKQINFIKKLTTLVQEIRSPTRKLDTIAKKVEFLREYLSTASNELLKFEPFPLPLDPSIIICGCYPKESSVFKSSLSPVKITFKTVLNKHQYATSQIFGKKGSKHGKYRLMFKIGDDLRQDQFVIQIINLMDQLLKNENLDLKLTPYKILATSPVAGLIQFVENETLDAILANMYPASVVYDEGTAPPSVTAASATSNNVLVASNNGILSYLRLHSEETQQAEPQATSVLNSSYSSEQQSSVQPQPTVKSALGVSHILMDNYVKSCAAYCVITYILGVGDRHLDNLLISPNGKFWHADFGYMFGRDPKPFPPLMKLPIQVIDGMGGMNHENYDIFKSYCFITYNNLRKNSNLILNLFQLMIDANIPDIKTDPQRVIENVQDKFCLEMSDEGAMLHFQDLINNNVGAFYQNVIDRLHSLAQYWRA
ncbi:1-phosphatidylinositol 3-kinase [Scheffersomyces coipomensis]|uniref:1-phosphatidylinositol 3-kinase n=1 Tax=Scheffersomyces coipomensis TaxID=1788519 RepID=UPI00315CF7A5